MKKLWRVIARKIDQDGGIHQEILTMLGDYNSPHDVQKKFNRSQTKKEGFNFVRAEQIFIR